MRYFNNTSALEIAVTTALQNFLDRLIEIAFGEQRFVPETNPGSTFNAAGRVQFGNDGPRK